MKLNELKVILKRLYKEYVKKHFKRIIFSLSLALLVALSTSSIAWLLDPAVKKIFIDKDPTYAWLIPLCIILAFSTKGISLYFARVNIIYVGQHISGKMQKQVANNILLSDIQTLESRHSGKYIGNIMYDSGQVNQLVSVGVLNLMKDTTTLAALLCLMFYQNWKLSLFAIIMIPLAGTLSRNLGKKVGRATTQAGVLTGDLIKFLTEVFQGSKMIRIYQKEKVENENANKFIDKVINQNIKILRIMIRATPIMEVLTGIMIAGFIFYSGKLIAVNELQVNQFY